MFVFVGCSYNPWPIAGYRDAFSEVMKTQNTLVFEFADVRIESTWILDKVRTHIQRCDLGLFDITFLNPNVLLELGLALGMKKRAHIFLNHGADEKSGFFARMFSQRAELPVNLQGLELVKYATKAELISRLLSLSESLSVSVDPRTLNHSYRVRLAVLEIVRFEHGLRITEIAAKSGESFRHRHHRGDGSTRLYVRDRYVRASGCDYMKPIVKPAIELIGIRASSSKQSNGVLRP